MDHIDFVTCIGNLRE